MFQLNGTSHLAVNTHTNTQFLLYIMYPIYIIWPYIISIVHMFFLKFPNIWD
jgi:hypothetical protein